MQGKAITPDQTVAIKHLLKEGVTYQKIGDRVGVSKQAVYIIAKSLGISRKPEVVPECPQGPVARCTKCGAMVTTPCRACWIREQMK